MLRRPPFASLNLRVPSWTSGRSFHVSSSAAESTRKRHARVKKSLNVAKRADSDAKESSTRPHPVLGLSSPKAHRWTETKLYQVMVHPEDLEQTPSEFGQDASASDSLPGIQSKLVNVPPNRPAVEPPKLLNFGLSPTTADHLLNTLPDLTIKLETTQIVQSRKALAPGPAVERDPYDYSSPSVRQGCIKKAMTQSDVMARVIDLRNASAGGIAYENRRRIVEAFSERTDGSPDTGRPEVQAALLTAKIRNLWEHLSSNSRDIHNRRALRLLVHQRAKILAYLKRMDMRRYNVLLPQIGVERAAVEGEIVVR